MRGQKGQAFDFSIELECRWSSEEGQAPPELMAVPSIKLDVPL